MPLHLLQHKSWHVGSIQNQERVRRDERNAKLKEEEEERRMQEVDAERRMALLRQQLLKSQGNEEVAQEISRQLEEELDQRSAVQDAQTSTTEWGQRDKTKKRRRGEGDEAPPPTTALAAMKHTSSNTPLIGHDGHINLFPPVAPQKSTATQNPEYLADRKREEASFEAQYTMQLTRPSAPWYSNIDSISQKDKEKSDKRKEKDNRVEMRIREQNDPLKSMQNGLRKLKEVNGDRESERRRRDAEVDLGIRERLLEPSRRPHGTEERDWRRDRSRSPRGYDRPRHDRERHQLRDPNRHARSSSRSRSRSPRRRKEHRPRSSKPSSSKSTSSLIAKLREEATARETAERRKTEALLEDQRRLRAPEKWTASTDGGKGKYSRQFGL